MTPALPVVVDPRPGEAIDSWLERLADVNGMRTSTLGQVVAGEHNDPLRFLTLAPDPRVVARIAELAHVTTGTVRAMTLAALPGATDLTGLDPADGRSFRRVAARGWVRGHGTQICPECLNEDGIWRLTWRLPIVAVCARHHAILAIECPSCRRPFRDQQHSILRPDGSSHECGNPIGRGPNEHCERSLASITSPPATSVSVETQRRVDDALDGHTVSVFGASASGQSYLADLRHLATLLLHLANQEGAETVASWSAHLQAEAERRTKLRGPRWGIGPPRDAGLRSAVLASADQILRTSDLEAAAYQLVPWLELTPQTNDGPLGWLADRTVMTPRLSRLVFAGLAPHRRLSHHLDTTGAPMRADPRTIPQVIPHDLYVSHLADAIDSGEQTVRVFASLCIARAYPEVRTWVAAAEALGMPGVIGARTARACSARMRASHGTWTRRLTSTVDELPRLDFRAIEGRVRHRNHMTRWYDEWAREYRPGSRPGSVAYALIWQWVHVAHGHIDTAPAWRGRGATAKERALYRQFEDSLDRGQQQGLIYALYKRA